MSGGHVLVVGGRDHTLDKIERLGARYAMMQIPSLVNPRQYIRASRYAVMDYTRHDETLAVARAWHEVDPFDAVVSFTEYGLEPASLVAAALGVAGDNLAAVRATRDKTRTRELLDRHGLSPVRHRVCPDRAAAARFLADLDGAAMVLKPCDGGLSEGVCVVHDADGLADGWRWTRRATDGPVLAEEFLTGPEYSVESISHDGRHEIAAVTEKLTTPLPRFIELGHQAPARLDGADHAAVVELVTTFLTLVGQRTGPAHTEIRLTPHGPRIIESQTRFGGDQIWELCELVSGVDLMSETVAALLGLPQPGRQRGAGGAAIRFFGHENVRVVDVTGVEQARHAPGAVRVTCSLAPGQQLGPLLSSDSRQGYVLCTGADTAEAAQRAEAARDLVRVGAQPLELATAP